MRETDFSRLPDWRNDDMSGALSALQVSCRKLASSRGKTAASARATPPTGEAHPYGGNIHWAPICDAALRAQPGESAARHFFETWFTPHTLTMDGKAEGLLTGYYEPELRGDVRRHGPYQVPLYGRPDDLAVVNVEASSKDGAGKRRAVRRTSDGWEPYHTRADIDAGALAGKGLEILWLDDPVDAFFLQIQGSGRVRLPNGEVVRVGYGGNNGHPYVAIGRVLVERGVLSKESVTMQSIRDWLRAHPQEASDVMAANPRYIFFRVIETPPDTGRAARAYGPIGAQGVPLTPGRSIAVDPRFVSFGVPVWIETVDPLAPEEPLRRLVIAQDTGSAIKGAIRGDLFWGAGTDAEARAGAMKHPAAFTLLLPNTAPSL